MNLADMLCYADIDQLTRIAATYGCECSSHSKNDLIQTILSTIHRREALESRMAELGADDLRFLNSLLFENRTAYSLEELRARAGGTAPGSWLRLQQDTAGAGSPPQQPGNAGLPSPRDESSAKSRASKAPSSAGKTRRGRRKSEPQPEPAPDVPADPARQMITRFRLNGWLFNGCSQQTRFLFQVPEDVRRRLRETLEQQFLMRTERREEPPVYRDESDLMAEDLTVFLRFVRDHDVPLTADGTMYKRQLGQVLELMSVQESIPGKGEWRFGYGRKFREYPDRFSLLYDFAYCEGLLREQPDRLVLTEEGLEVASGQAPVETERLYRLWLRIYKGPIDNLTALVHWIARLAGEWTTVASLFEILRPLIRPYYYDDEKAILERRVLRMMLHLGLLRWGETEAGEPVVKMTPHGQSIVIGTVLPYEDLLRFEESGMTFPT